MPNIELQTEDIIKFCKEISEYKSLALLNLPTKVLKLVFLNTLDRLKNIFVWSLQTGIVQSSWKHATIIPLQKEGDTKDVNNLLPISLLPLPGELLEELIKAKLSNFLELNNILDQKQ